MLNGASVLQRLSHGRRPARQLTP
jgi:hypothetical protein